MVGSVVLSQAGVDVNVLRPVFAFFFFLGGDSEAVALLCIWFTFTVQVIRSACRLGTESWVLGGARGSRVCDPGPCIGTESVVISISMSASSIIKIQILMPVQNAFFLYWHTNIFLCQYKMKKKYTGKQCEKKIYWQTVCFFVLT